MHVSELVLHQLEQVVELFADFLFRSSWQNLLHHVDSVDDSILFTEGLLDEAHGDLLLVLGTFSDDADAVLVESDNDLHHTQGLVQGTVVVIVREGVLLKELILDDLSRLNKLKGQQ